MLANRYQIIVEVMGYNTWDILTFINLKRYICKFSDDTFLFGGWSLESLSALLVV